MAEDSWKLKKSLNIEPRTSPTLDSSGDIGVNSSDNELKVYLDGSTRGVVTKDQTQTLTNKTLTTPVISSISNTGTLTLPTSTDTLVGRATTDTLTNKTLTAPTIDVATFDGQASAPANPSSGFYKVYVDDTTSKLQILDSTGTVTTVGTSAGGINYITNGDAESATTGWALYSDADQNSPVDGTGGSVNTSTELNFTRTTTNPLRGLGSFLFEKIAASSMRGKGASYAFTIADADKAKMMQIDFELEVNSGTYVTGDVAVYIYDVTNAAIIQPSGYQVENVGIESRQRLTFQTASNSTSYRLCFHVASTSALAYALKIDTITLGPQIVPLGAPVTDWVSYTPTLTTSGGGSITLNATSVLNPNGWWRRVGDSAEFQFSFRNGSGGAASGTAGDVRISIPSGLVPDTAKMATSAGGLRADGYATLGTTTDVEATVIASASGYVLLYAQADNSFLQVSDLAASYIVSGSFKVPIVGWSSSTVVSSSADTRAVYVTANAPTAGSHSSETIIAFTELTDSHGAFSSNTFTAPVPGVYQYDVGALTNSFGSSATGAIQLGYKLSGGTTVRFAWTTNNGSNTNFWVGGSGSVYMNAGQTLAFYSTSTSTISYAQGVMSIRLLQGPSQIAASEVIAMQTGGTPTGGNTVPFIFPTLKFETHGSSYNATTGVFTCPAPGIYQVSTVVNITNVISVSVYKNGSSYGIISATIGGFGTGTALVSCNAGDTITIVGGSAPGAASSSSFSVSRLGGVM